MPSLSLPLLAPASRQGAGRWAALVIACGLFLWSLALVSCALHRAPRRAAAAAMPTAVPAPVETRIGVVRALGAEQRFVLIETPSASATAVLSEGQLLHCRPSDALTHTATADLRVSREHHQTLVVANVVAGEPVVGAVVYATPNASPAASPAPGSISSVATAPLPGLVTPRQP